MTLPYARLVAVHPRVCGEHATCPGTETQGDGSSPRVRGTLAVSAPGWQVQRFIPACAGNTMTKKSNPTPFAVHPRVCGEHGYLALLRNLRNGSSPRVRGTLLIVPVLAGVRRFIPACAGNTTYTGTSMPEQTVHPRVCGEHLRDWTGPWISTGSSPRVRGTRSTCRIARHGTRFIPACAGNTPRASRISYGPAVHPRVCGEHGRMCARCSRCRGSSPRVRGTLRTRC